MNPRRSLFIGDVHGCSESLAALLEALAFDPAQDRLLLTGDAFTKGPDPVGVWRQIRSSGAEMVLGNHDAKTLAILEAFLKTGRPDFEHPAHAELLERILPIGGELLPWLRRLPLVIDEARFCLVHAGVNPERGLAGSSRDELLAIRTWPPRKGIYGPRWHEAYRPAADGKALVFGHDAPGGLVRRHRADGTPYLVGLDTGCVYGGELTAWILEEDRIVQVAGQKAIETGPPVASG
ncbi:MAG: metallophosphoesterase [Caldilineae bacterium]|nr:metallophosphoesterase [Chloroflexota bacterium]MCB9176390.1 metallophosphoesterase [Caldilineae bacterium]